MTNPKVILILFIILAIIGFIADMITISQSGGHLWDLPSNDARNEESALVVQEVSDQMRTVAATASPSPVPPLEEQLRDALAVSGSSSKNMALFKVAQHAVLLMDYWTAIRAADASPGSSSQAESLSFVVKCAIEDGKYEMAAEAAARIGGNSTRDRMRNEVIDARKSASSVQSLSGVDRTGMACFNLASQ